MSDRDEHFAGAHVARVAGDGRRQTRRVDAQQREIAPLVAPLHARAQAAPVAEHHLCDRTIRDVRVRHNRAVAPPDHAGARAAPPEPHRDRARPQALGERFEIALDRRPCIHLVVLRPLADRHLHVVRRSAAAHVGFRGAQHA